METLGGLEHVTSSLSKPAPSSSPPGPARAVVQASGFYFALVFLLRSLAKSFHFLMP